MKYSQVLTQSFFSIPASVILSLLRHDDLCFNSKVLTKRESRQSLAGVERDTETETESFAEVLRSLNAVISE